MAENVSSALAIRRPMVEWVVPIAAVGLVFVMLVPMPSFLLDLLLAASITASVLVLLSALHILRPAQFSVFPSLLLLLTLFRLSLNLASSRRILLHGNEGASAAGDGMRSGSGGACRVRQWLDSHAASSPAKGIGGEPVQQSTDARACVALSDATIGCVMCGCASASLKRSVAEVSVRGAAA